MDLEAELLKLDRARALRIIANTLGHLSDKQHTLALSYVFTRAIELGEALDVQFISLPPDDVEAEFQREVDEGCQYGGCPRCRINLSSTFKRVNCPFCGREAHLT